MRKDRKRRCWDSAQREAHYNRADINSKIVMNLRDLSHVMRSLYEGRGSQKRILIVLDELGGSITQRELTQRLGIQPGSASEVFGKLESAGYVIRTTSKADRRTLNIKLTELGIQQAAEAKRQRIRRHEEMFSCLSPDEKKHLLLLLEKVNQDWEIRYRNPEKNWLSRDAEKPHGRDTDPKRGE